MRKVKKLNQKDDGIVFSSHHDTGNGNNCFAADRIKTGNLTVNVK